jgi:hypothetical protein
MTRRSIAVLILAGCASPFLPSEPRGTPEAVFDVYWSDFDAYYSFFPDKRVNWDSVRAVYRPRVNANTPNGELFSTLVAMAEGLQDGHITLYTPFRTWEYDGWRTRSPSNYFPEAVTRRLPSGGLALPDGKMRAGMVEPRIGYLAIGSFAGTGFDAARDRALETLRDADALIVDIRSNGGGSDLNSDVVQVRFADRDRVYAYVQYRNGPSHDDFTPLRAKTLSPAGLLRFTGPIALLTNRGVFSTAEAFTLAMRALPNVTVIGDTTGGGFGNPVWRELPNGWSFRLSRWRMLDAEKRSFEGTGVPPDVPLWITAEDRSDGVDTILEAAVRTLSGQLQAGEAGNRRPGR